MFCYISFERFATFGEIFGIIFIFFIFGEIILEYSKEELRSKKRRMINLAHILRFFCWKIAAFLTKQKLFSISLAILFRLPARKVLFDEFNNLQAFIMFVFRSWVMNYCRLYCCKNTVDCVVNYGERLMRMEMCWFVESWWELKFDEQLLEFQLTHTFYALIFG